MITPADIAELKFVAAVDALSAQIRGNTSIICHHLDMREYVKAGEVLSDCMVLHHEITAECDAYKIKRANITSDAAAA